VLGLDEAEGFQPVRLKNKQALKQALGAKARTFIPPVQLTIEDAVVDNTPVIAAFVHECDPSVKPCRFARSGKAYLRSYDGDYELSALEEQAFLVARKPPHFDRQAVDGATVGDLDSNLLAAWEETVRTRSPLGLGRFDHDELIRRAGVVNAAGVPTVAGILALGRYPQQFFPRYVIQAAVGPRPDDPPGTRVRNVVTIDGPIPLMLTSALEWARRSFGSRIVDDTQGMVRDVPDYPLTAFRELIVNSLIHRDLDSWSDGLAVEVRLSNDQLMITNPGGLYGITVDRLGQDHVTSARNARLVSLCQDIRTPGDGTRVIEALASGLPKVTTELANVGLPRARYFDAGIRFTVLLRRLPATPQHLSTPTLPPPNTNLAAVYEALAAGSQTAHNLAKTLALSETSVRTALTALRNQYNLVEYQGGAGRRATLYRRTEN
jgi:ATP-dependent DNA helicase RecG